MNGITILSESVNYTWSEFAVCILIIILGLFFMSIILMIFDFVEDEFLNGILKAVLAIILFGIFAFMCNRTGTPYNEYKVIMSDNVSLTEFYEKYEIVKQEGKIFTIKEK